MDAMYTMHIIVIIDIHISNITDSNNRTLYYYCQYSQQRSPEYQIEMAYILYIYEYFSFLHILGVHSDRKDKQ
jgi:hypothetical protein